MTRWAGRRRGRRGARTHLRLRRICLAGRSNRMRGGRCSAGPRPNGTRGVILPHPREQISDANARVTHVVLTRRRLCAPPVTWNAMTFCVTCPATCSQARLGRADGAPPLRSSGMLAVPPSRALGDARVACLPARRASLRAAPQAGPRGPPRRPTRLRRARAANGDAVAVGALDRLDRDGDALLSIVGCQPPPPRRPHASARGKAARPAAVPASELTCGGGLRGLSGWRASKSPGSTVELPAGVAPRPAAITLNATAPAQLELGVPISCLSACLGSAIVANFAPRVCQARKITVFGEMRAAFAARCVRSRCHPSPQLLAAPGAPGRNCARQCKGCEVGHARGGPLDLECLGVMTSAGKREGGWGSGHGACARAIMRGRARRRSCFRVALVSEARAGGVCAQMCSTWSNLRVKPCRWWSTLAACARGITRAERPARRGRLVVRGRPPESVEFPNVCEIIHSHTCLPSREHGCAGGRRRCHWVGGSPWLRGKVARTLSYRR
jgi:hypothetical protein